MKATNGVYDPVDEKARDIKQGHMVAVGLYLWPAVVGLVGLISLVAENMHSPLVWKVTAVFGSVVAAAGLSAS